MKAVNLIPSDARGGGSGRSGVGAYLLIGVLGVLLAGAIAYVLTGNAISSRETQLAGLRRQTSVAQAQAQAVKPYREFAALAQARVQTVRGLGRSRFDWHRTLAQLATVIPGDVSLNSLLGTVTNGVTVQGGSSGPTSALRSALPNPAIEISGCTVDHDSVARLISHLRLMSGAQRVSLADSQQGSAGARAGSGSGTSCPPSRSDGFDLVVFFAAPPAVPTASTSGAVAG